MTIENISWSISTKKCCRTWRDRTHELLTTSRLWSRVSHRDQQAHRWRISGGKWFFSNCGHLSRQKKKNKQKKKKKTVSHLNSCLAPRREANTIRIEWLIVLGFNDTSTLEGHFVSSPREREKRDRRESRGDEREGQGRKRNRNESEETEEIKTFPLYPYPLQG